MKTFTHLKEFFKVMLLAPLIFVAGRSFSQLMPPQPNAPVACNSNDCTVTNNSCLSGFSASFQNGTFVAGSAATGLSQGAVWQFGNVSNIGAKQINATVTIDTIFQAVLVLLDDDNAKDENGQTTLQNMFAPNIKADQKLGTASRRGYVQFTIRFWEHQDNPLSSNDFQAPANLLGVNYSHYDIDGVSGSGANGYQLRETGHVEDVAGMTVLANANTELVAYNYATGSKNWKGYAGSICNRNNTSRCAQVVASFKYSSITPINAVSVRMGYDYLKTGNSTNPLNDSPTRLYASIFKCFDFPQQIKLPVHFAYFSAKRSNPGNVGITWQTAQEINSAGFEIQRQIGSGGWQVVAFVNSKAQDGNSSSPLTYIYTDNNNTKAITQYRLRSVDIDANSKFSETRSVRGDGQPGKLIVYPNPSFDGKVKVAFEDISGTRDVSLTDMNGRLVKQWRGVTNNNLEMDNITPGYYSLRVIVRETGEQSIEKIIVNKR